jgi:hypothetical protein
MALIGADAIGLVIRWPLSGSRGLPSTIALDSGGRDLDDHLLPFARRIGAGH